MKFTIWPWDLIFVMDDWIVHKICCVCVCIYVYMHYLCDMWMFVCVYMWTGAWMHTFILPDLAHLMARHPVLNFKKKFNNILIIFFLSLNLKSVDAESFSNAYCMLGKQRKHRVTIPCKWSFIPWKAYAFHVLFMHFSLFRCFSLSTTKN